MKIAWRPAAAGATRASGCGGLVDVVPANAGTHMWTAPVPQEFFDGLIGSLASICPACWCGWDRWPRWFSATRVPNTPATFTGQWVPRIFSHLGSIDPTICLLLQLRLSRLAT